MKNLFITFAACCLLVACGNNQEKDESQGSHQETRETENYPTYDTTQSPEHINDSVSEGGMRSGGNLRHNVDANGNGQ